MIILVVLILVNNLYWSRFNLTYQNTEFGYSLKNFVRKERKRRQSKTMSGCAMQLLVLFSGLVDLVWRHWRFLRTDAFKDDSVHQRYPYLLLDQVRNTTSKDCFSVQLGKACIALQATTV